MAKKEKKEIPDFKGNLDDAIDFAHKTYGKESINRGSMGIIKKCDTINTGSFALDLALGVGGLPRGRVVELFGPEGCGKTTLALHVIAEAQKEGGEAAFIDAEHALDSDYAGAIGVDMERLLLSQPDNGEQALGVAEIMCASRAVNVVVIDSVAALVPESELSGLIGDSRTAASIAQLMSVALRRLKGLINKSNTLVIFINQLRMKIGVMFGNPEITPGGRALKFYASVRIDVRKSTAMKDGEDEYGTLTKVKVIKNKVAPPFKKAEFDIIYGEGIDNYGSILILALENNIVDKNGSWFSYGNLRLGNGKAPAGKFLRENPDICKEIEQKIKDKLIPEIEVAQETDEEEEDGATVV